MVKEITDWDFHIIRHQALVKLTNSKDYYRYHSLVESVLEFVMARGYNLDFKNSTKLILSKLKKDPKLDSRSLMNVILNLITELNIDIIKDETRDPTWSKNTDIYYKKQDSYKKPWMF